MTVTQFEFEYRLRFECERDFVRAVDADLAELGGRTGAGTVRRPTIFFDTDRGDLRSSGVSLSVVVNSGFGRKENKIVLKCGTDVLFLRQELIQRVVEEHDETPGPRRYDFLGVAEIGERLRRLGVRDLRPRLVIRQERYKRTVQVGDQPLYLSFDRVTYLHLQSLASLATEFYLELESTGSSPDLLLPERRIRSVADFFSTVYGAKSTDRTKYGRGLELEAQSTWDLTTLFDSEAAWRESFERVRTAVGPLNDDLRKECNNVYLYASLRESTGAPDPVYRTARRTVMALLEVGKGAPRRSRPAEDPAAARNSHAQLLATVVPQQIEQLLASWGESTGLANFNRSLGASDVGVRAAAYNAHYTVLRSHRDKVSGYLQAACGIDAPAPLSGDAGAGTPGVVSVRTLHHVAEMCLPFFHELQHARRRDAATGAYTMRDVQCDLRTSGVEFPYADARAGVATSSSLLGDAYAEAVDRFLAERRIDAFAHAGKRAGNRMLTGPMGLGEYVLLNYDDNFNSVVALAHEVAHAVHCRLKRDYPALPRLLKETVARVGEWAVISWLTERDHRSPFNMLERVRSQFLRPMYQTALEVEARHRVRVERKVLTADFLSTSFGRILSRFYGDALDLDDIAVFEWVKGHYFFAPYSVIEYAASFLLSHAVYNRLRDARVPFTELLCTVTSVGDLLVALELDLAGVDSHNHFVAHYADLVQRYVKRARS